MTLTTAQLDRAVRVLLGTAAGDSLGAPYEFGPPRGPELEVAMVGGGGFGWEPGEWTDDTSMSIAIAEVAATGKDLRHEEALDALTLRWHEWSQHAKDIGVQTSWMVASGWNNGWVVEALQAAWSAIFTTPVPEDDPANGVFRVDHLRLALDAAVRGGNDTDTVAAIAGGLLGAAYGASAVPAEWRRLLHGWPGMQARDLVTLANRIVRADAPFEDDLYGMYPVRHPHDDGVWLADLSALKDLPAGVDTVVSLCRVSEQHLPSGVEQIDVRLIDDVGPEANPNLDFVLTDTARLIEQLRGEGRSVLLHCVACQSRTPTVAALYGARRDSISGQLALQEVTEVLPAAWPNSAFREALHRLAP